MRREVSVKVPVGYWATSMIRPSNWASRSLLSLWMVSIGTLKDAAVRVVPLITKCPETDEVRPTAVAFCPSSTSPTRYSTLDPAQTAQVPATDPLAVPPLELLDAHAASPAEDSDSPLGVLPLKKWM
jgi:hypothetical protein